MTQQTYGETLFAGIGGAGNYAYTPWMSSVADAAVFGVEIFNITSSLTLKWSVETKNSEQDDSAATELMADQSETSTGVKYSGGGTPAPLSGCLELYRYRFATGVSESVSEWVNFRELAPSWQLNGRV